MYGKEGRNSKYINNVTPKVELSPTAYSILRFKYDNVDI